VDDNAGSGATSPERRRRRWGGRPLAPKTRWRAPSASWCPKTRLTHRVCHNLESCATACGQGRSTTGGRRTNPRLWKTTPPTTQRGGAPVWLSWRTQRGNSAAAAARDRHVVGASGRSGAQVGELVSLHVEVLERHQATRPRQLTVLVNVKARKKGCMEAIRDGRAARRRGASSPSTTRPRTSQVRRERR
jgi:hypothetical protein